MTSTRPATVLTPREVEVLQGLVDGYSPKEMASKWVVSRRTIDIHLGAVYRKLGARDRVQAVVAGLQQGLVQFPDDSKRGRVNAAAAKLLEGIDLNRAP